MHVDLDHLHYWMQAIRQSPDPIHTRKDNDTVSNSEGFELFKTSQICISPR